jgi:hypothetical protein
LFLGELDAGFVDEYLERRRGTRTAFHSRRALAHLLGWLAGNGLIPAAAAYPAPAVQDMRSSRPFTPTC